MSEKGPMSAGDSASNLVKVCHGAAVDAGWWRDRAGVPMQFDYTRGEKPLRNIGEMLALIHSEISEALEAVRKNANDQHLRHMSGLEVELADALIRICDMAGGLNLDLGRAVREKLQYNARREDHKPENRAAVGGKAF